MSSDPDHPPTPRAAAPGGRRLRGWAVGILALALVGVGVWLMPEIDPIRIINRIGDTPGQIAALLVLMMILHNFLPIPAEAIAICAGATLGIAAGAATIWVGAMLGAVIAFGLSRGLGRGMVASRTPPTLLARIDESWKSWGATGLIGLRLVPLISFNLVNYGAGLTTVGWWTFLWTTAIGILPVLLISVAAGAGLHARFMGPSLYVVLALLFIGLGLARYLQRRRRHARTAGDPPMPDRLSPDP